jgi:hypothetical protein
MVVVFILDFQVYWKGRPRPTAPHLSLSLLSQTRKYLTATIFKVKGEKHEIFDFCFFAEIKPKWARE